MTETNSDSDNNNPKAESPQWNWTTKLIVGLALVAIAIWLVVQFQMFLGPLITAFILSYLIHPIAEFLQKKIKIPWRISVTLIYLFLVLSVLGLLTWGGFALVDQIQNLIRFVNNNIDQLPELVEEITTTTYEIGPFSFSPSGLDWEQIANEIVGAIQPALGRLGSLVGSLATGAVSIVSWIVLILLVSYFLLAESEGLSKGFLRVQVEGYTRDFERMNDELNRIWQAFIRGEILVVLISLVIYTATLGVLGIQFFFGLSLIAAVGQLIPYVGAWVTWISFGLVALFQNNTPFDLPSGIYMLIVLGVSMVVNNIIDNIIRTKVMAESLEVHPALVLIGALIGVRIFGFIGIIIAAPIMASLKLILNYVIKKLSDQDPWESFNVRKPVKKAGWLKFLQKQWQNIKQWSSKYWQKIFKKDKEKPNNPDESNTQDNQDS